MKMLVYEKLVGDEWDTILVRKLKKGDTFRISEGGKFMEGEGGETRLVAVSEPYKADLGDGMVWTIDGNFM